MTARKSKTHGMTKDGPDKETKSGASNGRHLDDGHDGVALLVQQHASLRALIKTILAADSDERDLQPVRELCSKWSQHATAEQSIAYPLFEEAGVDPSLIYRSALEADLVSVLVSDLVDRDRNDPAFEAVLEALAASATRAMDHEEDETNGIYTKARSTELDLGRLAEALKQASSQHGEARAELCLLRIRTPGRTMEMREYERDRDERGRFVEDDRRGRGGQSRYASQRGSSRYDDDDGRGWHGDSRGHSEASQRGWDTRREGYGDRDRDYEDDRRGRGGRDRGYDSDDDRGGYRSRSQDYDDDRRRSGGWFGDSEGHSEASRRGWDNPDHGPSGWYGDREGHRDAARRGWDNPDHGPSGWFGDSEGHSEASRRGWDDRRRGSSRRR